MRVLSSPIETAKGVPAGIGRMLSRTARSVQQVAQRVGDAARSSDEPSSTDSSSGNSEAGKSQSKVADYAREYAGLNRARRALAKSLGVDPYTGNAVLQEKLESLAWASVAGGLSLDLALGALTGGASQLISISGRLDRLVWDLPPAEVSARMAQRLLARGNESRGVRRFLRTPAFTPSLQLRMVESLENLGRPIGEDAVLALAAQAGSEVHARFLITQLRMLAQHASSRDPVVELIALQHSLAAETRSGIRVVPLPVDFLSYTEAVDEGTDGARRLPSRLLLSGKISRLATRELKRRGWEIRSELGLPRG